MLIQSPRKIAIAEDEATIAAPHRIPATGPAVPTADAPTEAAAGLHPAAVVLGLAGFGLFLAASWLGWGRGETAPLVAMVTLVFLVYFGMLAGLGRDAARRRAVSIRQGGSFDGFLAGRVDTCTGFLSGRAALAQIAFTPLLLGSLMAIFAVIWPLSH